MHIAMEETKFGLDQDELMEILESPQLSELKNIQIQEQHPIFKAMPKN